MTANLSHTIFISKGELKTHSVDSFLKPSSYRTWSPQTFFLACPSCLQNFRHELSEKQSVLQVKDRPRSYRRRHPDNEILQLKVEAVRRTRLFYFSRHTRVSWMCFLGLPSDYYLLTTYSALIPDFPADTNPCGSLPTVSLLGLRRGREVIVYFPFTSRSALQLSRGGQVWAFCSGVNI